MRQEGEETEMNILTIRNVHKTFGKGEGAVKALNGINLTIEKGKFTAIIGASGSGGCVKIRLS